jgi:hypothetical protein
VLGLTGFRQLFQVVEVCASFPDDSLCFAHYDEVHDAVARTNSNVRQIDKHTTAARHDAETNLKAITRIVAHVMNAFCLR